MLADIGRRRAVENVVGFVLVFSLIASSVGVIYTFGIGGLQDTRDAEQLSNVESAFDVFADNLKDVQQESAPHRATEFKLYEATLAAGDPVRLSVTVENWDPDDDDTAEPLVSAVNTRPIVYRPETSGAPTTIRLVGGAVIREDRGGARVLNEPPFVIRDVGGERTAAFPLIQAQASGTTAVSGSTTVLVRVNRLITETLASATDPAADTTSETPNMYNVTLAVETSPNRAAGWERSLNARFDAEYGIEPCSTSGGTVTCSFEVDRLFVSATRVEVRIEN